MSLKQITFLTLVLSSIIYCEFSGPTFAGAWKRVQQCDSWDQVNKFLTTRIVDLQDNVDLRGSDLDKTRLSLWQARQKAVLHLQAEDRSPGPQALRKKLSSIDTFEEVIAVKEAKKIAFRELVNQKISERSELTGPLGSSRTYGIVVEEHGFGPIYRLPLPDDPKGKGPADALDTSSLFYDDDAATQAAIRASLGLDDSSNVGSAGQGILEWEEASLALAMRLSLEEQGASSSHEPAVDSSAGPTHPSRSEPHERINMDDLEYEEL